MPCTGLPPPACACPSRIISSTGVLLMELVTDAEGHAAPRLNDLELTAELAREYHRC